MARPIAYNASGPLSGSIRGGSVNYTIDGAGRDYTTFAGKKWVPSADGAAPIIFVTDSFTRGLTTAVNAYPLFFSCAGTGSDAILYTANRLPGSPGNFTDTGSAFYDLGVTYGYFILEGNDPYQGDDADGLVMDIDASKISSYPQSSTKWFDISGNGVQNDLVNGPVWDNNGWFTFDGTDDYGINMNTLLNITGNVTMNAWIRHSGGGSVVGNYAAKNGNNGYRMRRDGPDGSKLWLYASGNSIASGNIYDNLWYMVTGVFSSTGLRAYINGDLVASNGTPYGSTPSGNFIIADFDGAGSELFGGDMMGLQVYRKALTESEIKQNYFGAPIVTDGMVFAVDANNIISYPKSGTSWFNLTGSNVGTLINGPTFNQDNGGSIKFDGTDDYVNVPTATNLDLTSQGTISVWINPATLTQGNFAGLVSRATGGSVNQQSYDLSWRQVSNGFFASICNGAGTYDQILGTFPTISNAWYNIVFTWNGSQLVLYNNGVVISTGTQTINSQILNTDLTIGGYTYKGAGGSGEPFNGKIANTKLYNRGLTAAEVQQNYQAEQYRFEGPAGPVTNGLLLYWDAGNLDSYPGTGTTIYDLSGNGNNGTLYNGVGYNQTNGGVLTFDGVDDYVGTSSPSLPSTNNTVMGAARYSGGTRGRMINATSNNWLIGCWNNSTENYYAEGWVSPVQNGANDTNWRIVTALGDVGADIYTSYTNNVLSGGPNNGGSQGPAGITVGKIGYTNSEYSTGQFSFVLVYNRVLTTAEMTQNYNYFKGRFGL